MKYLIGLTTFLTLLSCNHCGKENDRLKMLEFNYAEVVKIDSSSCFIDYWLLPQDSDTIKIFNCYCGLGDYLDLNIGDVLTKEMERLEFHNQRTDKDLTMNCCDH